jgi:polyhydroxybutyrate depolymerase
MLASGSKLSWLCLSLAAFVGCSDAASNSGTAAGGSGGASASLAGNTSGGTSGVSGGTAGASAGATNVGGSTTGGSTTGGSTTGGSMTGGGGSGGQSLAGATNGGSGGAASKPSAGCGIAAAQAQGMYVQQNITSGSVARSYRLRLPNNYAPMRAYPLIVLGHGCTGNGGTPFPIEQASKDDAIVVALKSVGDCFEYSPTGPDVKYFDDVLAEVSAKQCVDGARVFMAGFSSGSWLTHTIGCVRAGIVRGQGNASGNQVNLQNCTGPIAAMFAHDVMDDQNSFAGAEKARDRILAKNGCSTETQPYDYDGDPNTPSTCVEYQGCMPGYPVVWCPTMAAQGKPTHNSQVPISTVGFWRFWSSL